MPTFPGPVRIEANGDQILELTCTNNPQSRTRLLSINSNGRLEGQIQFLGEFSCTGMPGTPSNPNGDGPKLTYRDNGILELRGGVMRLFHPNQLSGTPHVELTGNEARSGGGLVNITDGQGHPTITLDGNNRRINGHTHEGEVMRLFHPNQLNGTPHVELTGNEARSGGGLVNITDGQGHPTITLDGNNRRINGHTHEGEVMRLFYPGSDVPHVELTGRDPSGGGRVNITDENGDPTITLNGHDSTIHGHTHEGEVMRLFYPGSDVPHVELTGRDPYGGGQVNITDENGATTITLNGHDSTIHGHTHEGEVMRLFHPDQPNEKPHVELIANETAIGNRGGGLVNITDGAGNITIQLDGSSGDIILSGADCAEEFEIAEPSTVSPGDVLVIGDDECMRPCSAAYDGRVAGVLSGAGGLRPGIVLDRQGGLRRAPIALAGKVMCRVDADLGAIGVGDLLTTSPTLGHAMRANDPTRAFGAVLGKALRALPSGRGLVPVLVGLQ